MEVKEPNRIAIEEQAEVMAHAEDFHRVLAQGYREAGLENFAKEEEELANKLGEAAGFEWLENKAIEAEEKRDCAQRVKDFIEDSFFTFLCCKGEQESFFFENSEYDGNLDKELEMLKEVLVSKDSEDFHKPIPTEAEAGLVRFYTTRFNGVAIAMRRIEEDKGWWLGLLKRTSR